MSAKRKWMIGCGIGCGLVIAIALGMGGVSYFFVKRISRQAEEISRIQAEMTSRFGPIEEHSLAASGALPRDRVERFLAVREALVPARSELEPQFERYRERFRSMGIAVDEERSSVPDEENVSAVDIGLLAQVYANLFSNALKYTEEIKTDGGEKQKYISYGCEVLADYFGSGKDGLKYNVFSTGPHIAEGEREKIFDDQYRGSNIGKKPGSGHGLAFIKNVVEIHGGVAGYEATHHGNNFYFILPKEISGAEAPVP